MNNFYDVVEKYFKISESAFKEIFLNLPEKVLEDFSRMTESLLEVYIGQNIRPDEGILLDDCSDKEMIDCLIRYGLVEKGRWYKFSVLRTTDAGSEISRKIITGRLKKLDSEGLFDKVSRVVLSILGNINELNYYTKSTELLYGEDNIWKILAYSIEKYYDECKLLLDKMENNGLVAVVHDYVSTRGGEERDRYYVICKEVSDYLKNKLPVKADRKIEEWKNRLLAINFLKHYGRGEFFYHKDSIVKFQDEIRKYINKLGDSIQILDLAKSFETFEEEPFYIVNKEKYYSDLKKFLEDICFEIENYTEKEKPHGPLLILFHHFLRAAHLLHHLRRHLA